MNRNMGDIKMIILSLKGRSDLKAYLELEKMVELIFNYLPITTQRKRRQILWYLSSPTMLLLGGIK